MGTGTAAKTFALAYTYGNTGTSAGHVTSITYASGNRIDIGYGSDGHAISIAVTAPGANPVPILGDIRYLPLGAVRAWTWGNSSTASPNIYQRGFDLDGRIVSYPLGHPATSGTVRTVSYDAAGRITESKHTGGPAAALLDQHYEYDGLDRLTAFDGANTSQRFQYDANGNRTQATFGANTYSNTIGAATNRLNSTTGPAPVRQNSYDAAGNLTTDGTIQYSYGSNGRLSGIVAGGIATSYRYNGLGQRVAKTGAAGVAVYYVYDEAGRLVGEYDGAGKAMQETVYLGGLPVAVLKQSPATAGTNPSAVSSIYYVYADHLWTPRVLTRASDNKMVWRWDNADPFGLDQPDQNPSRLGELTYNPRFPGQVFDKETNNHYNYFRDYDPQTGRYVQSDPIGLEGGINTYGYVGGNPLSLVDPYGLAPGDRYKSVDAAGIQAIRDINPTSIVNDREYGGRVYRNPDGSYSYTKPIPGKRKEADFGTCPPGKTNAGQYHTHGADSGGTHYDYLFSNFDMTWAEKENVPSYVGRPDGVIMKYTPIPGGRHAAGPAIIVGKGAK